MRGEETERDKEILKTLARTMEPPYRLSGGSRGREADRCRGDKRGKKCGGARKGIGKKAVVSTSISNFISDGSRSTDRWEKILALKGAATVTTGRPRLHFGAPEYESGDGGQKTKL